MEKTSADEGRSRALPPRLQARQDRRGRMERLMAEAARRRWSVEAVLALQESRAERCELVDGEPRLTAGGSSGRRTACRKAGDAHTGSAPSVFTSSITA